MITLLDTSVDLKIAQQELGHEVEQLLTPLTQFKRQYPESRFAIDNGAYAKFLPTTFRALLKREWSSRHLCRFVAVPDVVGSAQRTLEAFKYWRDQLSGWPLALVAQDGQGHLEIPWEQIDAIFIGGTTDWKMSEHAAAICKAGKTMEKWVHAGRVNTPARFEHFEKLGVDSIDGSGLARYSWMRKRIKEMRKCPTKTQTVNEPPSETPIADYALNGGKRDAACGAPIVQ